MFRQVGSVYFPRIFHPFQTQLPTIHPPRVLLQRTTLEWLHVQLPEWSRSQPGSRFSHKDSRDLLPICSTHQNAKFIKFHHVILRYLQLVGDLENWASNLINSESIIEISTPQWLKRNPSLHFDGTSIPKYTQYVYECRCFETYVYAGYWFRWIMSYPVSVASN